MVVDIKKINVYLVMWIIVVLLLIIAVIGFNILLSKKQQTISCNLDSECIDRYGSNYYCFDGRCAIRPSNQSGFFQNFLIGTVSAQQGQVIYYNNGWVGIGTTNPQSTLHVIGSFNVTGPAFFSGSICSPGYVLTTTNNGQLVCTNIPSQGTTITGNVSGTGAVGRIAFWNSTRSLSSNSSLYWDNSNGRIGIGTSNPSHTLTVSGGVNLNDILFIDDSLFYIESNKMRIKNSYTPSPTSACNRGEISWDTNYIYICVSNNQWKRAAITSWSETPGS